MKDDIDNTNWNLAAFGDMGKKQFEAAVAMQKEFVGSFEEMNRAWLARTQSEVKLATEFVAKLVAARSVPDVISAYQECASRQLEFLAEDGRQLLANSEKILQASTPLILTNGSPSLST